MRDYKVIKHLIGFFWVIELYLNETVLRTFFIDHKFS